MFRFLHAADIHLDSPLRGLAAYEGAPVEALRGASRRAFRNLIDRAIEENVAFVVIAGDLYDGSWKDQQTGLFLVSEMGRLRAAGIPAFLLHGNHDAESEITRKLPLPDNVRVFPANRPNTFRLDDFKVALHGQSFRTAAVLENLVPGYPEPTPGWFNVGVLHTALEGSAEHANYAPCSLQELVAKGYQYWALGHVHEHAVLKQDPWIVYPGNLQGRHARETGAKGAVLVTVDHGSVRSVERVFPDVLRWHRLHVDVSTASSLEMTLDLVKEALNATVEAEEDGRPVALRIVVSGQTAVHGALFDSESGFATDVRALAAGYAGESAWIEKVVLQTAPLPASAADSDALGELAGLLAEVAADPAVLDSLSLDLNAMLAKVPPELRNDDDLTELAAIRKNRVADLAAEMQVAMAAWISGTR